jgi:hypothetical protein
MPPKKIANVRTSVKKTVGVWWTMKLAITQLMAIPPLAHDTTTTKDATSFTAPCQVTSRFPS